MPVLRTPSGARVVVRSEERAAALGWPAVEPERKPERKPVPSPEPEQVTSPAPKKRRTRKAQTDPE